MFQFIRDYKRFQRKQSSSLDGILQNTIKLLIENDKKRDQALIFYTGLVALFLEFILPSLNSIPSLFIIINLLVIIFGVFIGFAIITSRKWHSTYVATAYVLKNLIIKNENPKNNINKNWNKYVDFEKESHIKWFNSTEVLLFIAYLVISLIPIATFIFGIFNILNNFIVRTPLLFGKHIYWKSFNYYECIKIQSSGALACPVLFVFLIVSILYFYFMVKRFNKFGKINLAKGEINDNWILDL